MITNPVFLTGALDPTKAMEYAEAIPYGLKTTLLGMGVVFAVLIILWIVLSVFRLVFYKGGNAEIDDQITATIPIVASENAPAPVAPTATDDAELIAAITAAIAVVMDAPETSFRVVSFRRTAKK